MKLLRRQFLHLAAGAAALSAVSRIARAQSYPERPVRVEPRWDSPSWPHQPGTRPVEDRGAVARRVPIICHEMEVLASLPSDRGHIRLTKSGGASRSASRRPAMSVPVPGGSGMISLTMRCGQLWASACGMDAASANTAVRTSRRTRGAEGTVAHTTAS